MTPEQRQLRREWERMGRLLRSARGFTTQGKWARRLGVSRSHYAAIETGSRGVPEIRRNKFSKVSGLSAKQLTPKFNTKGTCPMCGHKVRS